MVMEMEMGLKMELVALWIVLWFLSVLLPIFFVLGVVEVVLIAVSGSLQRKAHSPVEGQCTANNRSLEVSGETYTEQH